MDVFSQQGANLTDLPKEIIIEIVKHFTSLEITLFYFVNKELFPHIIKNRDSLTKFGACKKAAKLGYIKIVEYCIDSGCCWDTDILTAAAEGGSLETVKYCREQGCPWDSWTCAFAAKGGHLDVLRYCRERQCPWTYFTCNFAAQGGHLEILRYCKETDTGDGLCYMGDVIKIAASKGYFEIVKYCTETHCFWDEDACNVAAKEGHLDILLFLIKEGCPYDLTDICLNAAENNRLNVLRYCKREKLIFTKSIGVLM